MKKELIKVINDDLDYDKDNLIVCGSDFTIFCESKDSGGICPKICKPWVK